MIHIQSFKLMMWIWNDYVHWGMDLQVLEYIDIYLGFFGRIFYIDDTLQVMFLMGREISSFSVGIGCRMK